MLSGLSSTSPRATTPERSVRFGLAGRTHMFATHGQIRSQRENRLAQHSNTLAAASQLGHVIRLLVNDDDDHYCSNIVRRSRPAIRLASTTNVGSGACFLYVCVAGNRARVATRWRGSARRACSLDALDDTRRPAAADTANKRPPLARHGPFACRRQRAIALRPPVRCAPPPTRLAVRSSLDVALHDAAPARAAAGAPSRTPCRTIPQRRLTGAALNRRHGHLPSAHGLSGISAHRVAAAATSCHRCAHLPQLAMRPCNIRCCAHLRVAEGASRC